MKKNTTIMIFLFAALALFTVPANAAKQVNDMSDINLTVFVPCAAGGAGELVDLSGPLHTLITFTINGNNVSGTAHFQPQGLSGTGETTGDKYQATGVTKASSFKGSFQNGQFTQTYVNNFRIIGSGSGNNFLVHEVLHVTFNANGTVTVFHDNFSIDCK
ncbi:MAG: hypothetical protein DMF27_03465 [Verrucomicrobia bacterium]|jgi:hypothetical protein|nr:MAG: hypothetical protein DMF27_03465 [Verrucomicrobiota bacterium]